MVFYASLVFSRHPRVLIRVSNKENCLLLLNFISFSGGGWSLVVSVSGNNHQHLLANENNCQNASLCVPYVTSNHPARKLSDADISALANTEGTSTFLS